jgi:hypothetical protein
MHNTRGFTYFAWLSPGRAGHGFMASFTDRDGEHQFLSRGTDDLGRKLFRRFTFSPSKRLVRKMGTMLTMKMAKRFKLELFTKR